MVSSVNDGEMNKNTYVRTYGEMNLKSEEVRTNKKIMTTRNGNGENKKIGNTQHAVTERWVGHGQPWLTSIPTTPGGSLTPSVRDSSDWR